MTTIKRLKVSFVDKNTMSVVDCKNCAIGVSDDGEIIAYLCDYDDTYTGSIVKEVEIRVEEGGSVINI